MSSCGLIAAFTPDHTVVIQAGRLEALEGEILQHQIHVDSKTYIQQSTYMSEPHHARDVPLIGCALEPAQPLFSIVVACDIQLEVPA